MPKISVLMSVYNAERYLLEAVESILTQEFADFEFIIINDGSTDKSLAILEHYAGQDHRIRLVSRANTGLTKALNEALSLASGKLIARMDADDISLPERFKQQVEYLEHNPNCLVVGSEVLLIDMDGAPICQMGVPLSHDEIEAELLKGRGGAVRHPVAMIRRDAMVAIGGYRDQFKTTEDLDLFLRLAERGQLANLPTILLKYRLHLESVNFSKYQQQAQEVLAVLEAAHQRRSLETPVVLPPWRYQQPTSGHSHRAWAEMALKAGHTSTARKHAVLAVYKELFSSQSWRMMLRTIKGSLPWRIILRTAKGN